MRSIKCAVAALCFGAATAFPLGGAADEASVGAVEAIRIATEAYIYGYPARHLRHGAPAADQRGRAGCRARPDGADDQDAELSRGRQPLLRRAQRRHAVHRGLARRIERAMDPRHSRHGQPVLHRADARWVVGGDQGGEPVHDGQQGADVRDHRPRLEGHAPEGRDAGQVADRDGVGPRTHLQQRHARGLQGGARPAGQVHGRSAQRLRQAVHATAGRGRSGLRHEDGRAEARQRPRR